MKRKWPSAFLALSFLVVLGQFDINCSDPAAHLVIDYFGDYISGDFSPSIGMHAFPSSK